MAYPQYPKRETKLALLGVVVLLSSKTSFFPSTHADIEPILVPTKETSALISKYNHEWIVVSVQQRNPLLGRDRAERIANSVLRCTESQNLSDLTPRLVLSVMFQESAARPGAISPKGAIGLMQVMPDTYRRLELAGGLAHLETNIEAGCMVLADNIRRLGRDRGISAYFWGDNIRNNQYLNGVNSIFYNLTENRQVSEQASL